MKKVKQVNPAILKLGEASFVKNFKRRFGEKCKLDPKVVFKDLSDQVSKCKEGEVPACSVEV